jgi:hypothetical protein
LDHWDADTLAYYLNVDPTTGKRLATPSSLYPGFDVAIMFYASWCRNCHALAPYWDRIATHLKAGTSTQSKLVMALFDCERNVQHELLCTAASVTHYPTLMFVGSGPYHDSDVVSRLLVGKQRAAGPAGPTNLPNAVKFQGNWKYADSILDWIQTMQLLSRWHVATTQGWLRVLRNGILGAVFPPWMMKKKSSNAVGMGGSVGGGLPVGLPSLGSSGSSGAQVSALQKQVKELSTKSKDYAKLIVRSSSVVDALLFPVGQPSQVVLPNQTNTAKGNTTTTTNNNASYAFDTFTDVFAVLHQRNGWNLNTSAVTSNPTTYVILSCALDVILDVCQRVNTHVTTDVAEHYPLEDVFRNFTKLDLMINAMVDQREPYCGILDDCLLKNFEPAKCRPPTCPFHDPAACRYLTACLTEPIQTEYALALDLIQEGEKFPPRPPPKLSSSTNNKATPMDKTQDEKNKKGGVWGMF